MKGGGELIAIKHNMILDNSKFKALCAEVKLFWKIYYFFCITSLIFLPL
jgi:hypothetical protein